MDSSLKNLFLMCLNLLRKFYRGIWPFYFQILNWYLKDRKLKLSKLKNANNES
jgi:hypothetical protein